MIRSCTFMVMCLLMFLETLWCFLPGTKSFVSVCILYIPIVVQRSILSLCSTIKAKQRIKSMRENHYSRRSEKNMSRFSSMNVKDEVNLLLGKQKRCGILWAWYGLNKLRLFLLYIARVSHFFCFHLVPSFQASQKKIVYDFSYKSKKQYCPDTRSI